MARILLGQELGTGLGHVATLVPLARELATRGHEVLLALRDPVEGWPLLKDAGLRITAAPAAASRRQPPGSPPFTARSYLDILAWHGFGVPVVLGPLVEAWHTLFDAFRPDLVVAEHAPLLCVAAHGRVPSVNVGSGFTVPALQGEGFPALNPGARALPDGDRVAAVVAQVLGAAGQPVPAPPLAALLGDHPVPLVFPDIDPYGAWRAVPAAGPLWPMPAPAPQPAPASCLVYLPAMHPGLPRLLEGLRRRPMPGHAYLKGADAATRRAFADTGLEVSERPLPLGTLLPRVSVVLHHGGAGLAQHCLALGRPQVLAPFTLEQRLTANALCRANLAVRVGDDVDPATAGEALAFLHGSPAARRQAADHADALRARFAAGSLPALRARCESLAAGEG